MTFGHDWSFMFLALYLEMGEAGPNGGPFTWKIEVPGSKKCDAEEKGVGVPMFSLGSSLCYEILPSFLFHKAGPSRFEFPGIPARFQSFSKSPAVSNPFSSHVRIFDPRSLSSRFNHTSYRFTKVSLTGPRRIIMSATLCRSRFLRSARGIIITR